MIDLVRYGSIVIKTNHVNYKQALKETTVTERISVRDTKDILAEFLKHLDRYKLEDIHNIGLQVIEKDNKPQFVDVTWSKRETIAN